MSPSEKPPPFADRLAYLRWLKHLALGRAPSNKAVGEAAGVTGEAVTGWVKRNAPPPEYDAIAGLLRYFGIEDGAAWFRQGDGDAPDPSLWARWRLARAESLTANRAHSVKRGEPAARKRAKGE